MGMKNDPSFWSTHVAAVQIAGISTSAYFRQHYLLLANLYDWHRKLQPQAPRQPLALVPPTSKTQAKFVVLRLSGVTAYGTAALSCASTLVLKGGERLEMFALPEPRRLVAVDRANQAGH